MRAAVDFYNESRELGSFLQRLSDAQLRQPTAFKAWTPEDIVRHLHVWNLAALFSLRGGGEFERFFAAASSHLEGGGMQGFEREYLAGLGGKDLVVTWQGDCGGMAEEFAWVDPAQRVPWAGPSMSARSSITARLMETWAHGQAVYDALGVVREGTDRLRNIVVLGVNTYGWSFAVHGEEAPQPMPHLDLAAPSGERWAYGEPSAEERIEGPAEAFCQVVTQTRNVADTPLRVTGANANAWMRSAQCFAGPPETPPAPGVRAVAH